LSEYSADNISLPNVHNLLKVLKTLENHIYAKYVFKENYADVLNMHNYSKPVIYLLLQKKKLSIFYLTNNAGE